ncbi:MAG: transrane pair domain protein [Polaromonas sp.]|nr:transrane pair domain protein [Polaromonas sp.]
MGLPVWPAACIFGLFAHVGENMRFPTLRPSYTAQDPGFMHFDKSVSERFFQALMFELLAIAICAPLGAWLMGYSLAHIGLLTLMISLIAMSWNMVFNWLFDLAQSRAGFERKVAARVAHSLLFEFGLLLLIVPLAAWWLDIGLWEAFVLDIGIALFFLPYTFLFNLAYDLLRARFMARKRQRA